MMLFEVTNGYVGESYVHVICVAESEEEALEMAREKFRVECGVIKPKYPPEYYENLTAEMLCADTSSGFISEIYS